MTLSSRKIIPRAAFAFALLAGPTAGCETGASAAADHGTAHRSKTLTVVLMDVSDSIPDTDVPRWEQILEADLGKLQGGDSILILPMGVRSAEAAEIYRGETQPIDREQGLRAYTAAREGVDKVRREAKASFHEALKKRASKGTDIFGAVLRARAGSSIHIFSDMLQSDKSFDLERFRLRRQELPALVARLANERSWPSGALQGARVSCYLTAAPIDERRRPVNDRATLAVFWRLVFERLGARLDHFDSLAR